jgi:hypothetical protein
MRGTSISSSSTRQLEGGGRLVGRVHRHGCWPPGPIEVSACCLESWRFRPSSGCGTPQWHASCLWEAEHPLAIDPDAGWAAFCFALPDHLPPAVEARTIAWRYELRAQRHVRHWFNETAARTPLLHEDATLRAPMGAAGVMAAGPITAQASTGVSRWTSSRAQPSAACRGQQRVHALR